MSSKCEKNFQYCADDIDVEVKNFTPDVEDRHHGGPDGHPQPPHIKAKVLRKVGEAKITHPIRDSILIEEGFYAIKRISRRVVLTQCYVVPDCKHPGYGDHHAAHLFVEGYILKNVEYATPSSGQDAPGNCEDCLAMKNDYKDLTAKIKFDFCVPIELEDAVISHPTIDYESALLKTCMKPCDSGTMSESDCEKLHCQAVHLQEPFTCELDEYKISEAVITKSRCANTNPNLFDTVVEKLTLKLEINIFQLQVKKLVTLE